MGALLEALGKDPAVARKNALVVAAIVALPVAIGAIAFGARPSASDRQPCTGGPEKLAGIWEFSEAGKAEPVRHTRIRQAFLKTGKTYAADVWPTTSASLDRYARAWAEMYKETCEATEVHRAQSAEV